MILGYEYQAYSEITTETRYLDCKASDQWQNHNRDPVLSDAFGIHVRHTIVVISSRVKIQRTTICRLYIVDYRYVNAGPSGQYSVQKLSAAGSLAQEYNSSLSNSLLRRADINSKRLGVDLQDWIDSLVDK